MQEVVYCESCNEYRGYLRSWDSEQNKCMYCTGEKETMKQKREKLKNK